MASEAGNLEEVKNLLDTAKMSGKNADIGFKAEGTELTALHLSARNNHVDIVNFLLE